MILATAPSALNFRWTFPTPVRSIEFVFDLRVPVNEKSLVALVKAPEKSAVMSETWGFSNQLQGHYKYVATAEAGAIALPKLTLSDFVSELDLQVVPWGTRDLPPASAITSVWAIADSADGSTDELNIIAKGRLTSNV
ncbi:hypothetical protein AB4Y77_11070 [Paenarthrobacter sp. YAF11_1]|uniref:hypothetical protein n=1 Tax=Paenarthrobacter sp. YAF11_1 TaxID=3233074 RepID=UPI003F9CADB4